MVIFDVDPTAIAHHYESGVELSYLIQQEIFDNKSNEITLMILNILLTLKCFREFLSEYGHSYRKDIDILIKILPRFIIFMLIQFLR